MSQGARVLVVDDDALVLGGLLALLEAAGYAAEGHADAAGALAGVDPARLHCAVLDIHIGVPDGFALCAGLRLRAPALPVIFISGDTDPALDGRAGQAGALGFLRKPVDPECLLALIDSLPAAASP